MAAGRLQYPCHGCGVHGHWKKDGECNPADVAAFMKKKMAEQAKKDAEEEEAEDSGMNISWLFIFQNIIPLLTAQSHTMNVTCRSSFHFRSVLTKSEFYS
jgi:hypothetical protein